MSLSVVGNEPSLEEIRTRLREAALAAEELEREERRRRRAPRL